MWWKFICNDQVNINCAVIVFINDLKFLLRTYLLLTSFTVLRCIFLSIGAEIACDSDECFVDPCCLITTTAINASDFTFSGLEDESVLLFDSARNQNVEFLPIRISNKFPNLVSYNADRCAIREISKTNFANLFHLRMLNLIGNRLEIIKSDTFKDLVNLESLLLCKYLFLTNIKRKSLNLKLLNVIFSWKQNQSHGKRTFSSLAKTDACEFAVECLHQCDFHWCENFLKSWWNLWTNRSCGSQANLWSDRKMFHRWKVLPAVKI